MTPSIYFLRTAVPAELGQGRFRFSLRLIKVNNSLSAYLAFQTSALAELARTKGVEIVSASELGADHYVDFETHPIVWFETAEQVQQWSHAPDAYEYEKALRRYSVNGYLRPLT